MIKIGLVLFGSMYLLWIFFQATMSLKPAKESGILSTTSKGLGYTVVAVG